MKMVKSGTQPYFIKLYYFERLKGEDRATAKLLHYLFLKKYKKINANLI